MTNLILIIAFTMTFSTSCEKSDGHLDYGNITGNGGSSSGGGGGGGGGGGTGFAFSFGLNNWGQLGFPGGGVLVPTALNDGHKWVQLASLHYHTCAIDDTGDAYCWGEGDYGKLGNNNTLNQNAPVLVGGGHKWKNISAGSYHSCGVTITDEAYCWGWNHTGALGDATFVDKSLPSKVQGAFTWKMISAGYDVTCAITMADTAYCWGEGANGVTGNSDFGNASQPGTPIAGGYLWDHLSIGPDHGCGLTTSSVAYCWGGAGQGQLGDGVNNWEPEPVPVIGGHTFKKIYSGQYHVCGITTADAAYCWGYADSGQVGDGGAVGSLNETATPTLVVGGHSWSIIDPGYEHTCGITTAGDAYCWGEAGNGELGTGLTVDQSVPTLVSGGYSWVDIVAGKSFTIGVQ